MSVRLLPAAFGFVLALAGCHNSSAPGGQQAPRRVREVRFPSGITMAPALVIIDLEQDKRYRWAEPDSLVKGLASVARDLTRLCISCDG